MLKLHDDGPVTRATMARTAFGRPLEATRDRVLGPEGWMTTFTRGHFSKLNLLRSLVESTTDIRDF